VIIKTVNYEAEIALYEFVFWEESGKECEAVFMDWELFTMKQRDDFILLRQNIDNAVKRRFYRKSHFNGARDQANIHEDDRG